MERTGQDDSLHIPAKLYRIGELVRHTPFSRQTLHNYTIMGLIREAEWTQGGHRLYGEAVFQRLSLIRRLRKTKTLAEISRMLREDDAGSAAEPRQGESRTSEQRVAKPGELTQNDAGDNMFDTS